MDHANGDHHVAGNPESSDTPEQAKDQTDAPEKFSADGQKSKGRRYVHLLGEETHGAAESISAKPAKRLLCAVCEENDSKYEAENR
jgi:hypothetical protein